MKITLSIIVLLYGLALAAQPNWDFDRSLYSESMTIVGQLYFDSIASSNENDQVAALINGEIRGVTNSQPLESADSVYLVFLQVFSNSSAGDSVAFRLYHADTNTEVDVYFQVAFEANAILGQNSDPLLLSPNPILPPEAPVIEIDAENFFSPNGDGINDAWMVNNIDELAGFRLVIFNTYGEQVFETVDYQNDWEGEYKGNTLPADVYLYVFTHPERPEQFSGTISLVR
ncbi:MAG: gliding motility-associated C-terminal domain-containing protein [Bacteroidota bacterium]